MANECIPFYDEGDEVTCVTTADVVGKTFVDLSAALTTGLVSVATATAAGKAFGVAVRDVTSGNRVTVIRGCKLIVPVTAGGTIAYGAEIEVGTGGKAVTLASGKAVGRALSAGTNNNDVIVTLY